MRPEAEEIKITEWCIAKSIVPAISKLPGQSFSGVHGFLSYSANGRTSIHESARWEIEMHDTAKSDLLHADERQFFTAEKAPFVLFGHTPIYEARYQTLGYVQCPLPAGLCTRIDWKTCFDTIGVHKDVIANFTCEDVSNLFRFDCPNA